MLLKHIINEHFCLYLDFIEIVFFAIIDSNKQVNVED